MVFVIEVIGSASIASAESVFGSQRGVMSRFGKADSIRRKFSVRRQVQYRVALKVSQGAAADSQIWD